MTEKTPEKKPLDAKTQERITKLQEEAQNPKSAGTLLGSGAPQND